MWLFNKKSFLHVNRKRASLHVLFWCLAFLVNCLYYWPGIPSLLLLFITVAYIIPVHILYYYTVTYFLIPRFLYTKRYVQLVFGLLCCIFLAALAFRLVEIFLVVPQLYKHFKAVDPTFKWAKAEGTPWQQLLSGEHFLNAMEQSNMLIWIAVSIKFFKMWMEKRSSALQAELDFLKAQVHPHFLFNTLNNLYALTLENSPRAPETVLGLSEILRYMLYECNAAEVSLNRDIQVLKKYIALEQIRFESRLNLNVSVNGDPENYTIAPLLLLPLVENAFKHGAGEVVDDPWITVDIGITVGWLTMKVANLKPELAPVPQVAREGMIGLSNIRKRLAILYPGRHQLHFVEEDDTFVAILKVELG
jgi:histidine kinase